MVECKMYGLVLARFGPCPKCKVLNRQEQSLYLKMNLPKNVSSIFRTVRGVTRVCLNTEVTERR